MEFYIDFYDCDINPTKVCRRSTRIWTHLCNCSMQIDSLNIHLIHRIIFLIVNKKKRSKRSTATATVKHHHQWRSPTAIVRWQWCDKHKNIECEKKRNTQNGLVALELESCTIFPSQWLWLWWCSGAVCAQ